MANTASGLDAAWSFPTRAGLQVGRYNSTALARFSAKVERRGQSECWPWKGGKAPNGYGLFRPGGTANQVPAHRAAYELLVGAIPPGLTIDHVRQWGCTRRDCVNPAHLEPVTMRVNVLRGSCPSALNAKKDSCPRGHKYVPSNTRVYRGRRHCRACDRIRCQRRRAAVTP